MSHIMGGLAHIPKVLEELGSPTLLARRSTARARGNRRTIRSLFSATQPGSLHPSFTKTKGEHLMLETLSSMSKLRSHL
jgi:hypothetical protein